MKVAIYSRGLDAEQEVQLLTLLEELTRFHIEICMHKSLVGPHSAVSMLPVEYTIFSQHAELGSDINCIISLGGDGTLLDAATLVREKQIPIMGINFGRLGFLAGISKEELKHKIETEGNTFNLYRFIKNYY